MTFNDEVKFFANMFETDENYARQCLTDVRDWILAMIECGETVVLPGCFSIYLKQTKRQGRYNFQTRQVEEVDPEYRLVARFAKRLEETARQDNALKRFLIYQREREKRADKQRAAFAAREAKNTDILKGDMENL